MTTARRRNGEPMTRWNVYVPVEVAAAAEKALTNPVSGAVIYGGRSQLVTSLLREWLVANNIPLANPEPKP